MRVEFTKEMKQTHTILVPSMLDIHFRFLKGIFAQDGYHVEVLNTTHSGILEEGLRCVHNDTCYPATLVIGQLIDALKSGAYDLDHIALAITQTGGGCRASNYIHLLRKALKQHNLEHIPVISINFSGLEPNSGFKLTAKILIKLLYAFYYGDFILWLRNQVRPYEIHPKDSDKVMEKWIEMLTRQFKSPAFLRMKHNCKQIIKDFGDVPISHEPKIKVGIVGEIYMKYAALGNNDLENLLIQEGCEPVVSGVVDFGLYCMENYLVDYEYYGRNKKAYRWLKLAMKYFIHLQYQQIRIIQNHGRFQAPHAFDQVKKAGEGIIDRGVKMGEGWLLTSEMAMLLKSGVNQIVSCQPFGCLPNHIVARGMTRKLKERYPQANIVALDYDPSASKVNQENRLKLMLATARYAAQLYNKS